MRIPALHTCEKENASLSLDLVSLARIGEALSVTLYLGLSFGSSPIAQEVS